MTAHVVRDSPPQELRRSGRYRFSLAAASDDVAIRGLLRATPMPGNFAVELRREPDFFAAGAVEGRDRQVLVARDGDTGEMVGLGVRAISGRYVNGTRRAIGYLGSLRVAEGHRRGVLLWRGYEFLRELHGDGRAGLYLTTIAVENQTASQVLGAGRPGLPRYYSAGRFHTAVMPLRRCGKTKPAAGIEVRAATEQDKSRVLDFWREWGPRRQFFPDYQAADLFERGGLLQRLAPGDLLLAFQGERLVGTLGVWDQRSFRQIVVHGYGGALRWLRRLYNPWARFRGRPQLPAPGSVVRCVLGAVPVVAEDDARVFKALVEAALAWRENADYLMLGLHEKDPLLGVLRQRRAQWYVTDVYLVCWEDGEWLRESLDGRPPYLELGSL